MNALNNFVGSFKPAQPEPQTAQMPSNTLDPNWQRLKQGITTQQLQGPQNLQQGGVQ